MDYYVIYDKNDNIVAYCDNIDELCTLVQRRKKELKYRFKKKKAYHIQKPKVLIIYKFN